MQNPGEQTGRSNQKRRTRAAILDAAVLLLQQGGSPSVADAADAASVSRATAYRYFATQEHLLVEALLHAAALDINAVIEAAKQVPDPETRLDMLVQRVYAFIVANEGAFRTMLRLSLEAPPHSQQSTALPLSRLRGGRRLHWIEEVLVPIQGYLSPPHFQRLVASLALCMGIETQIVLRDVCNLDAAESEAIIRWMAQTVLRSSLAQVGNASCTSAEEYRQQGGEPPSSLRT
jgi:AcrR family transcriptional regulator